LVRLRHDPALLSNAPVTMLASQNALHDNPCILDGDNRSLSPLCKAVHTERLPQR
jgi:hypothetical protein